MLTRILAAWITAALNAATGSRRRARAPAPPDAAAATAPPGSPEADAVIGETVPSRLDRAPGGGTALRSLVALTVAERRTQMYLHGSTGTGKTVLLNGLLDADVAAGRGVILLDARGDLVDRVLLRLAARYSPEELRERLVLIDLRQHAPYQPLGGDTHCTGFNPLVEAGADPYGSALFAFDTVESEWSLGVQTAEVLRNALLALALASAE